MLDTMERAIGAGPFLLGDRFTMADIIFGGTLSYMLMTKSLEARPAFTAYAERLTARPGSKAAHAKNESVVKQHNLKFPGS
jgi:glutathione S-transferase